MTASASGRIAARHDDPAVRSRVPGRTLLIAVTPLLLFAGYVLALLCLFALVLPPVAEAALLALLWLAGAAASVACGLAFARHPVRPAPWWAVAAAYVLILPLAATPALGPRPGAVLLTVTAWAAALALLLLLTRTVAGRHGMASGAVIAGLGGALLAVAVAFLSARLHLPAAQVPWSSMPFWLPVAVTDHLLVGSVNRVDAVRVASGVSVLLPLVTGFFLAYTTRLAAPPAQLQPSGLWPRPVVPAGSGVAAQ